MMKATLITRCLMFAGLVSSLPAAHAAGTWFEARNDAMGGTGVASSAQRNRSLKIHSCSPTFGQRPPRIIPPKAILLSPGGLIG